MKIKMKNTKMIFQKINYLLNCSYTLTQADSVKFTQVSYTQGTTYKVRIFFTNENVGTQSVKVLQDNSGYSVLKTITPAQSGQTFEVTPSVGSKFILQFFGSGSQSIDVQIW